MTTAEPTQTAPDFEEQHRFTLALLSFLGVDPATVKLDSLTIFVGADHQHVVTWQGRTRMDTDELSRIAGRALIAARPCDHDGGRTLAGQCQDCGANIP